MADINIPGERGPKGDHGQQGDSGLVGVSGSTGERGAPGSQGVAGPTGAAGAAGAPGGGGAAGAPGVQGDPGAQGIVGATGTPGKDSPVIGRTQVLTLFAFVVFAFVLLAYRTEHDANSIKRIQHENCVSGKAILEQFNAQQRTLAQLDIDHPLPASNPAGRELQAARIEAYRAAIVRIPNTPCPSNP